MIRTKNIIQVGLAILIACLMLNQASAETRVVDGDTIEHNGITYRLFGIDAPEAGQKCNKADGGTWPCGKASISAIESLVLGEVVSCDNRGLDDFGRTLGVCKANGQDINAELVRLGLAWAFTKFSDTYADLEQVAKSKSKGIWQANTQTAWDFRAARWDIGLQKAPDGCPIKGNISPNGRIYHAPWSPWYNRTKISEHKGERWFCNEAEAIAAGWRAPYWGR